MWSVLWTRTEQYDQQGYRHQYLCISVDQHVGRAVDPGTLGEACYFRHHTSLTQQHLTWHQHQYLCISDDQHMGRAVDPGALGDRLKQVAANTEPTETKYWFLIKQGFV